MSVFNAFITHRPVHLHVLVLLGVTPDMSSTWTNMPLNAPLSRIALFTCMILVLHCDSFGMFMMFSFASLRLLYIAAPLDGRMETRC